MNNATELLSSGPSLVSVFFRTATSLLFVLAIVCLAVWVLKIVSRSTLPNTSFFQVLSRLPLGGKKSLCIVKVGEKAMILGLAESTISKLGVINFSDLPEKPGVLNPTGKKLFSEILSGKIRQFISKPGE